MSWRGNGFHANLWSPWQQIQRYQTFGFLAGKPEYRYDFLDVIKSFTCMRYFLIRSSVGGLRDTRFLTSVQPLALCVTFDSFKRSWPAWPSFHNIYSTFDAILSCLSNLRVFCLTVGLIHSVRICCLQKFLHCYMVSLMRMWWATMKCRFYKLSDQFAVSNIFLKEESNW